MDIDDLDLATAARLHGDRSLAVFSTLLQSAARPGQPVALPDVGVPSALAAVLAIVDLDHGVTVLGDDAGPSWRGVIARATSAAAARIADADVVLARREPAPHEIASLRIGSASEPERGARLFVAVDRLGDESDDLATSIEVSGPGVADTVSFGVDGLGASAVTALAEANTSYPAGVDTWLVDGTGRTVALPRSCTTEIRETSEGAD